MEFARALELLHALERERVAYVVVGSMAMAAHGLVRATRDLDLFVEPSADNVDRLRRALRQVFDDPCIDEISAADLAGAYPAIRYVPPDDGVSVDILARLGDAFAFDDIEAVRVVVPGGEINVATPRMLVRMKRGTLRALDGIDAAAIRARFSIEDE